MMPSSASIIADRLCFAILPTRTASPKGGSLRRDNFAFFFFFFFFFFLAGIIPKRAYGFKMADSAHIRERALEKWFSS